MEAGRSAGMEGEKGEKGGMSNLMGIDKGDSLVIQINIIQIADVCRGVISGPEVIFVGHYFHCCAYTSTITVLTNVEGSVKRSVYCIITYKHKVY